MCGVQYVVAEGKVDETVNMFYGMTRRAGREMEIKITKFQEWNYWFDE
jgi:hypothetical protein